MNDWQRKRSAADCAFCRPRNRIETSLWEITRLASATLYLERIQTYRGHCVLVFDDRHVTRIDELEATEWRLLADEIRDVQRALVQVFDPDHVNVASLGQVVPHLHWHIIPRYEDDPRWGGPIWMTLPTEQQEVFLSDKQYAARAAAIHSALASIRGD